MGKGLSLEEINERIKLSSNDTLIVLDFINNTSKATLQCRNCNKIWTVYGGSASRYKIKGCPYCNDSIGMLEIYYNQNPMFCLFCNEIIPFGKKAKDRKFCSQSCAAKYNNPLREKIIETVTNNCLYCDKQLDRHNKKYCSITCQNLFQRNIYITRWKQGLETGGSAPYGVSQYIRSYLFDKFQNKCEICGWGEKNPTSERIPLAIHHIDGYFSNNQENNLMLLCPNCHSLTSTYGNLNAGNGRKERHKYFI